MSKYSEKFKDPRWQKKRLVIMKRDKFTCKLCGDTETTLNIHHKEYISGNDPWDYPNSMLVTLCQHCHEEISRDYFKDVPFKEIRIYKSDGWTDGSRIMFTTHIAEKCVIRIYDGEDNFIIGYNLISDIPDIIKVLRRAYNG